ncbi:MAG TPA: glycosyltransferase family 4 protein [Candidatus Limnocylindria bacterium]
MTSPRVLLTVGTDTTRDTSDAPRRDFTVLAADLEATLLDRSAVERSRVARAIQAVLGFAPAQAWLAYRRRDAFDVIVTDGEHVGIPLALLLRTSRSPVRHVTIGHRLTSRKKRLFFRVLGVQRRIDRFALHSRRQRDVAVQKLDVRPDRVALIPYQVDTKFWAPRPSADERLIVSAGLEHRDYGTFFRAVTGLDAHVVVGAASHWSKHAFTHAKPPENVRIGTFDYAGLRSLYARAAIVVVPLNDVDNQAGVTTILEAMSMGRPVIVTQSLGQTDVVEDRRRNARGAMRQRPQSLARSLATDAGIPIEPTGFYVAPGDAAGLRKAIDYLLAHPEERERLGHAGRRLADELFTVERFAERMRALVTACVLDTSAQGFRRTVSYG